MSFTVSTIKVESLKLVRNISHFLNYDTKIVTNDYNAEFLGLYSTNRSDFRTFFDESKGLQLLDHPALNKLTAIGDKTLVAFYHDTPSCVLSQVLNDLDQTERYIILYGIASALNYLHQNNIFFCNLNTTQIYLNRLREPKLDAYGFSCFVPKVSELPFVAPELLTGGADVTNVDIFTFGYFMLEVLTGIRPSLLRRTSDRYIYTFPNEIPDTIRPAIVRCIKNKPNERCSFEEIMKAISEAAVVDLTVNDELFKSYVNSLSKDHMILSRPYFRYPATHALTPTVPKIEIPRIRFRFNNSESARPGNPMPLSAGSYFRNSHALPSPSLPLIPFRSFQMQMFNQQDVPNIDDVDIEELMARDDPDSHYIRGYIHETKHEYNEAFRQYKLAANSDHSHAQYRLGLLYLNGNGCKQNMRQAAKLFLNAAKQRHSDAAYQFCMLYHERQNNMKKKENCDGNIEEDNETEKKINEELKQCMNYLQYSADIGFADSLYKLAYLVENGICFEKDQFRAFELYRKAAIRGVPEAQYHVANLLLEGKGTPRIFSDAAFFLQKATKKGHLDATYKYAELLERGIGVQKNLQKAAEFYREAAFKGHNAAKRCYAKMLKTGNGIEKNERFAFTLMKESANGGDVEALVELGEMYENGCGTNRKIRNAFECFQKAAQNNNSRAYANLALMYESGLATSVDHKKAAEYFKLSADKRDPIGQFHYARILENGIGTSKDLSKAAILYRLSANQGYSRAQYNIARYLEYGLGVERDRSLAIQYYKCAARQGVKAAEKAVLRLRPNCL